MGATGSAPIMDLSDMGFWLAWTIVSVLLLLAFTLWLLWETRASKR